MSNGSDSLLGIKKGESSEKEKLSKTYKTMSELLVSESDSLESRENHSGCSFLKSNKSYLLTVTLS